MAPSASERRRERAAAISSAAAEWRSGTREANPPKLTGEQPYSKSNGDCPVVRLTQELCVNSTAGRRSTQRSPDSRIMMRRVASTVRLVLSDYPSACGWYAVVMASRVPAKDMRVSQKPEVKQRSRSLIMTQGTPHDEKRAAKYRRANWMAVSDFRQGRRRTALVYLSVQEGRESRPPQGGRPSTKLTHRVWKGATAATGCRMPGFREVSVLTTWQLWQELQYSSMSRDILDQKTQPEAFKRVRWAPGWPISSCKERITSRRQD